MLQIAMGDTGRAQLPHKFQPNLVKGFAYLWGVVMLLEERVQAVAFDPRHLHQWQHLFAQLKAVLVPGKLHELRQIVLGQVSGNSTVSAAQAGRLFMKALDGPSLAVGSGVIKHGAKSTHHGDGHAGIVAADGTACQSFHAQNSFRVLPSYSILFRGWPAHERFPAHNW